MLKCKVKGGQLMIFKMKQLEIVEEKYINFNEMSPIEL